MGVVRRRDREREWWIDFRFRGTRIRRPSPDQTKRGALAFERALRAQMVSDVEAGRSPFVGPAPLLRDFAPQWMQNYVAPQNRPTTVSDKESILRVHLLPALGHLRLDEINKAKLDGFVATLVEDELRPKTINNILSALHCLLSIAVEWDELRSVPKFRWQRVGEQPFRFLSNDESAAIISAADSEFWRTFILFLLHTGARFGEAAAMPWNNLVLQGSDPKARIWQAATRRKVKETKTEHLREVPLNDTILSVLSAFPRSGPFPFAWHGQIMHPASSQKFLHRMCRRAGIVPCGWHAFRHTFATDLTSHGVPLNVVQKLLGHSSIKMTERYAHAAPSALREAVGLLGTAGMGENPRAPTSPILPVKQPSLPTRKGTLLDWYGTQVVTKAGNGNKAVTKSSGSEEAESRMDKAKADLIGRPLAWSG